MASRLLAQLISVVSHWLHSIGVIWQDKAWLALWGSIWSLTLKWSSLGFFMGLQSCKRKQRNTSPNVSNIRKY